MVCLFVISHTNTQEFQYRKQSARQQALRRHDRVGMAERRRRNVMQPNIDNCGCCQDESDDYRALAEMRASMHQGEEYNEGYYNSDDDDDDDNNDNDDESHNAVASVGIVREQQDDDSSHDDDLDDEYDDLLNDNDLINYSELEQERRAELELQMLSLETAKQHGYGVHRPAHPVHVFDEAGLQQATTNTKTTPQAVVIHLYDPDSFLSASLDMWLEKEADSYRGTKFLRTDGRLAVATLIKNKNNNNNRGLMMIAGLGEQEGDFPALLAVRDGVLIAACPLRAFARRRRRVEESMVEEWLDRTGVLLRNPPPMECSFRSDQDGLYEPSSVIEQKHATTSTTMEEDDYYSCGVQGCQKVYAHQHIGMETEEQDGRLVSMEDVMDI
mmetsp:Transcript_29079/g.44672  ORF Transcript_29079/g.44672 Transcript_29079/m.44672 type:complete len:385 (-) Transcript_29079:2034-3188(-)